MSNVTELIHDLTTATGQMKQAALTDDWALAEKIQKRRAQLIERIVEYANAATLTEQEANELNVVREQEATIIARAGARHRALGQALAETQTGRCVGKQSRMQKAYGAPGIKRP
ncbi:flagellar protein FliT [Thiocystis minor]|uniref:flagellar protein FliT n=1 Tax=Thiocystis minor TaxID=61597 RepID=UPI001913A64D|nr:flagellar protein FliT [Thiocystis minor]